MKAILAVLALAVLASAHQLGFQQWASLHGKSYTNSEVARRQAIYHSNLVRISKLNDEHKGVAQFGVNMFADLTEEEFQAKYLGARPVRNVPITSLRVGNVPAEKDWRNEPSRVGPVKNQGSCGSCWAFATVAHLENKVGAETGVYTKLSEQQFVDCDHECQDEEGQACDSGCNGGWMVTAMRYALKSGVELDKKYPYKAMDMTCNYDKTKVSATFTGNATQLPGGAEDQLLQACNDYGTVSVAVNANPMQFYWGGIIHRSCSSDTLNHGVAVVGWGHDNEKNMDFWIVRNSWGSSWGEDGYCRIQRGEDMCGISQAATVIIPN